MKRRRSSRWIQLALGTFLAILLTPALVLAAGGTGQVAWAERPVQLVPHWPDGVVELLNDPARSDGWNPWFTEWPSDVNHYQFEAQNPDHIDRLIRRFARIKSDQLQIRLSTAREPRGIGWVSRLPEGNGTPVLFSLGDQQRIHQWFERLGGNKFGVMEFEGVPRAIPPTLTLFVQSDAVDLSRLQIPSNVDVAAGEVPRVFSEWKLKPTDEAAERKEPAIDEDAETQKAAQRIDAFIRDRQKSQE